MRGIVSIIVFMLLSMPARAETVNCIRIDHLPVTVTTQGVYCLTQNLSTSITTGTAINIAANNITLDCNGYKVGGLGAGPTTNAMGIAASNRTGITVRNCAVRGFNWGIMMNGGAAHVIEGNRLDGNTYAGIGILDSGGDIVRDNYIVDTGGNPPGTLQNGKAFGIGAQPADSLLLQNNTVVNTFATAGSSSAAYGIGLYSVTGVAEGNHVITVLPDGAASAYGLYVAADGALLLRNNSAITPAPTTGQGISVLGTAQATCKDNLLKGFSVTGIGLCVDAGGNYSD